MNGVKTLTQTEYDVLCKIARKTKMDCWFLIEQTEDGTDYVYDCESGEKMSLANGVSQLVEELDCVENYNNCDLSNSEQDEFIALLNKLEIDFDVLKDILNNRGV